MASTERGELYRALKEAGYPLTKPYQNYTLAELKLEYAKALDIQAARTGVAGGRKDENELPTQRRADELTPIRTDEQGRVWFQEEIQKSTLARPRGYRVHREVGSGVKKITLPPDAEGFTEEIEISDGTRKPLEVRVGIPTWQVGIYKEPNMPFRTVVYRDARGFYREDVEKFFGGPDVLPEGVEAIYVGNLLCYPIRETVVAITREYNQLEKKGSVV